MVFRSELWLLAGVLFGGALPAARAEACFASPEAAARAEVGSAASHNAELEGRGFRAQDLLVDASLRRVWIRVRRCGLASSPLLLVSVGEATTAMTVAEMPPAAQVAGTSAPRTPAIHTGEPLKVGMQTETARITVEGTAEANAAIGDQLRVRLQRNAGGGGEARILVAKLISSSYAEVLP